MPRKSPAEKIDCDDLLSRHGAGLLADVINAYWRDRGYSVQAERYELPGMKAWGVRSSMVNGLPLAAKQGRTAAIVETMKLATKRKAPLMTDDDRCVAARRAEFLG